MTNKRRYLYLHKGDNEWLASDPPTDDSLEEWNNAWEELKAKCPHEIEITEDMYANDEYGDLPEWVDVTIDDEGVLAFKMARGVIGGLKGARSVVFDRHYDLDVSEEWGGWGYTRLEVFEGSAYLTFRGKDSSSEVEVNITEQFNQAIGE
jgi:hypothetical protein